MKFGWFVLFVLVSGCVSVPDNVRPISGFDLKRYLGQWYEIARMDHSFERNLTHVTANYQIRDDGGIVVVNRGYSAKEGKWKEAKGRGYFAQSPSTGFLKVSFFGPFYGAYVIFDLDFEGYQYSLVCGPNKSYLWILSRQPSLEESIRAKLVAKAAAMGFDTSKLINVPQSPAPAG